MCTISKVDSCNWIRSGCSSCLLARLKASGLLKLNRKGLFGLNYNYQPTIFKISCLNHTFTSTVTAVVFFKTPGSSISLNLPLWYPDDSFYTKHIFTTKWVFFLIFADNAKMCLCVCVGVRLSRAALCNLMSYLCSEEGNRDSWLELHTAALPRALRPTDRQADRLVSDIIRKWKHWMPLYGLQSAITRVRFYIGS